MKKDYLKLSITCFLVIALVFSSLDGFSGAKAHAANKTEMNDYSLKAINYLEEGNLADKMKDVTEIMNETLFEVLNEDSFNTETKSETITESTLEAYITEYSSGIDGEVKVDTAPVDVGAVFGLSESHLSTEKVQECYSTFRVYKNNVEFRVNGTVNLEEYLTEDFVNAITNVKNEKDVEKLFENYGTHYPLAIAWGGYLEMSTYQYAVDTQSAELMNKNLGAKAMVDKAGGAEANSYSSNKEDFATQGFFMTEEISGSGGTSVPFTVDEAFSLIVQVANEQATEHGYSKWRTSIDEGKNLTIVSARNEIAIWELLELDESTSSIIEDAFNKLAKENKINTLGKYGSNVIDNTETFIDVSITSVDDWSDFAENKDNKYGASNVNVTLANDIDFGNEIVDQFQGVFKGSFNGNGHTMSNMVFNTTQFNENIGLFSTFAGSTLSNLNIENVKIYTSGIETRDLNIGIVAGKNAGIIKDVEINDVVMVLGAGEKSNIGGVVGINYGDIINVEVADVLLKQNGGSINIGGISGANMSKESNYDKCFLNGMDISMIGEVNFGGIIGRNNSQTTIGNSLVMGVVTKDGTINSNVMYGVNNEGFEITFNNCHYQIFKGDNEYELNVNGCKYSKGINNNIKNDILG